MSNVSRGCCLSNRCGGWCRTLLCHSVRIALPDEVFVGARGHRTAFLFFLLLLPNKVTIIPAMQTTIPARLIIRENAEPVLEE